MPTEIVFLRTLEMLLLPVVGQRFTAKLLAERSPAPASLPPSGSR